MYRCGSLVHAVWGRVCALCVWMCQVEVGVCKCVGGRVYGVGVGVRA